MAHWDTLSPFEGVDCVFLSKDREILLHRFSDDVLVNLISSNDRGKKRNCDRAILHLDLNYYTHDYNYHD